MDCGYTPIAISLAEFLDRFLSSCYPEITIECVICDVPGGISNYPKLSIAVNIEQLDAT